MAFNGPYYCESCDADLVADGLNEQRSAVAALQDLHPGNPSPSPSPCSLFGSSCAVQKASEPVRGLPTPGRARVAGRSCRAEDGRGSRPTQSAAISYAGAGTAQPLSACRASAAGTARTTHCTAFSCVQAHPAFCGFATILTVLKHANRQPPTTTSGGCAVSQQLS